MSHPLTRAGSVALLAALVAAGAAGCYATGSSEHPGGASAQRPRADAAAPGTRPAKKKETRPRKKKPAQTVRQAWGMICHAERLSGADKETDRGRRGDVVAAWLAKNLKNKQVIYWYLAFGKMKKPEQPAVFRAEARKAGFADCPLQRLLFSPPPDAGASAGG